MPNIESAKKAMRQSRRHAVVNRAQRSALRTALKRVRAAGTKQEATQAYAAAVRLLDRAARKGLIHKNNAARNKSRLAKYVRTKA
ncbi:MAG: 30S ribosomal protein S20 [Gemmatimonadetes bacterium RBG_16_66_8]|nr:MAG: 30S ribosomal protein S20 [Gemmatimonadetes bacterium RBG_16_66_8]